MKYLEIFLDSIIESTLLLPYLLISYFILEFFEKQIYDYFLRKSQKDNWYSPLLGVSLGVIPQCGFSTVASKVYAGGYLKVGTFIAIILMTSDEAIPLLITSGSYLQLLYILIPKLIISLGFGYLINFLIAKKMPAKAERVIPLEEEVPFKKVVLNSVGRALVIFLYIVAITTLFGFLFELVGEDNITEFMGSNKYLAVLISSFVGLIPNCASSLLITKLYINDIISLGTVVTGLCVNSGVAFIALFKENKNVKENVFIVSLIWVISLLSGIVLTVLFS